MFQPFAWLIDTFYGWTHNYAIAVGMVALAIMLLITPLTLKSTKGMLEMQRLQPEMKKLQNQYKGDRQRLNEEMMKLYQEHKVNPLASCLPLLAQMPVFIIMFQALNGLIKRASGSSEFTPKYLNKTSELYQSLVGETKMVSFGIDLALTPVNAVKENFATGLIYVFLVGALAALYFVQQKMVASRTVSPTMSATQAKLMQYLPVFFAVFQLFLPTGLIVYYMVQAIIRIGQQQYITQRFYGNDSSLGRQAQAAGERAREMSKNDKESSKSKKEATDPKAPFVSKRVTPPKGGFSSAKQSTPPGKNRSNAIPRKPKKS
jgi:YidC/Oxa1 family membrane protein insertase